MPLLQFRVSFSLLHMFNCLPINGHDMIKTAAEINFRLTRRNRICRSRQLLALPALSHQPCHTLYDIELEYDILNVRTESNKGPLLKSIYLHVTKNEGTFQFKLWPLLKCA
jgi:hypothetical protein